MMFQNREEVAQLLIEKLKKYRGQNPLILGIPRGAIPMAKILGDGLGGELDVVLVHKIGAPGNPEYAIGSVSEDGKVFLSDAAHALGISDDLIAEETKDQLETLRRRRAMYTPIRPPISPEGRIVIIVDDGIATGSTMIAALRAVRAKQPAKLICAVGVAPPDTLARIAKEADEVISLAAPLNFYAVGQFFKEFTQVSDDEVITILESTAKQSKAPVT